MKILALTMLSVLMMISFTALLLISTAVVSASPPKMKMTTDISESIIIPNKLETRIGTLEFFDGLPSPEGL
jgi:hypothetical protein